MTESSDLRDEELPWFWRSLLRTARLTLGRSLRPAEKTELRARLDRARGDPAQRVIGLRMDGRLTGGLWFERRAPDIAFLLHVEVKPRWRGRGMADRLWGVLQAEAAALGAGEIRLAVAEDNLRARHFYARHGLAAHDNERRGDRTILELRGPVVPWTSGKLA